LHTAINVASCVTRTTTAQTMVVICFLFNVMIAAKSLMHVAQPNAKQLFT